MNNTSSSVYHQCYPCVFTAQLCRGYSQLGTLLLAFLLAGLLLFCSTPPVQAAACSGSAITGLTFRDYNANGVRDASEPGLAGIVVTTYDTNGATTACETTATGSYGIDPAGAYPVRVEFTLPADGSLNFLKPGAAGPNVRTSVTFVDGPTANVDVGFSNPADFCGANPAPTLTTSCMVFGEQNDNPAGVNKDHPVLVSFPYTAGDTNLANEPGVRAPTPTPLAVAKQLGSVWGLAWNPLSQTLYTSAFMKRHSGFGPGGPGAIYQITAAGPSLFHNFGALAGTDPHPQPGQTCLNPAKPGTNDNFNCWLYDSNSFDQVGKVGFGDLDINETFDTLYTVNLANNTLLSIPIANPGAFTTTAIPTPTSCLAVDLRPFGLGVKDGKVYVGAVCSAESTQNRNNLRAYVFVYANGTFAPTPLLDFPLTYNRGSANTQWQYWLNRTTFNPTDPIQADGKWAQPWVSDIVFDKGDMILGLRDRDGDLLGSVARGPDPATTQNYSAKARGDILRVCANGSGSWSLETNGACGGVTTGGVNNGEGPGGGEYYYQDRQLDSAGLVAHNETTYGALVQVPGLPDLVATIFNPIEVTGAVSDSGIKWYNNSTGTTTRGYLILDATGDPAAFEKANGLGDLEALCPAAPLEIGNRVWRDTNGDGIQGPDEPGLDGITVELYRDGQLVGTTVTANDGQYLFTDSNVTLNSATGIEAGLCGPNGEAVYEVRIPNAVGGSQQAALQGLSLTQANNGGTTNGEVRDSNGTLVGVNAVYAIPCSDLSAPGFNNHTYDFGFTPAQTYSLGNYVWIDSNNDGQVTIGEGPVPNGVVVELLNSAGTPTGQTSSTVNGFYLFSGLPAGSYRVRVAASNFQASGLLATFAGSTGINQEANPEANGDQNDNGLDTSIPATEGISSALVTLTGNEPLSESPTASGLPGDDGQGTADANSNLTVDFGVVPIEVGGDNSLSLGNRVWLDTGVGDGIANNGIMDGTEPGIANVLLRLLNGAGVPVTNANGQPLTTRTDSRGYYIFNNLVAGDYIVLIDASNFGANGPLLNLSSSEPTESTPNDDIDINDNGLNDDSPAVNGIRTGIITLAYNNEPVDEIDLDPVGSTQLANMNNLTVDFGFVSPTAIDEAEEPAGLTRLYLPSVWR